jgi:dynein heavy chain
MNIIEHAIRCGKAVLLQNVREQLDPSVTPVLNKAVIKQGNEM